MRARWRPSQRARTDAGLPAGRRAPHQGPIEGRRAPRRWIWWFALRPRSPESDGCVLDSLPSYLIERVALFARVRCRQPDDVLPVGKPEMQPPAAEEDPEEPLAARAAPFHLFVASPSHDASPPCTRGDTVPAPVTSTVQVPREPGNLWHRVLRHSRKTTPGHMTACSAVADGLDCR